MDKTDITGLTLGYFGGLIVIPLFLALSLKQEQWEWGVVIALGMIGTTIFLWHYIKWKKNEN